MEYETVKQKEKKISVKICKGSIWEELKESLSDRRCYDDKKTEKKKLTVDVNVKREFRSPNENIVKDDSWMNRIKSALGRNKGQDQITADKKEAANKQQKRELSKIKQVEKKVKEEPKGVQGPEKIHDPDLAKEKSQNILSQTKNRNLGNKNKEQVITETIKGRKVKSHDEEIKKEIAKSSLAVESGDAIKNKEKHPLNEDLKSSRQKGNKYEVQINNNVAIINPDDCDDDSKESEDRAKRRQITKDKRSKSKPATAKEKWSESFQGKKSDTVNEPTLESIKNLKSSILSLRVVDKKTANEKDKLKDYRNKREETKKKRMKGEDEMKITTKDLENKVLYALQNEKTKTDLTEIFSLERKKRSPEDVQKSAERRSECLIKENVNDKSFNSTKKRKDAKGKIKGSQSSSNTTIEEVSSTMVKSRSSEEEAENNVLNKEDMSKNNVNLVSNMLLDERIPIYSSSCCSGSSSSDEHECSCGCMDSKATCQEMSDSSPSSSSSIEYLRSYSGNLIMCAHGKKPVLSEHIRYLSTCIKL